MDSLYLGSHLPLSAPEYYLGTVKLALEWGENTFMFYTGAPQNTRRAPTSTLRIEEGRALLKENGIDETKIVVHAPYIINLGNKNNVDTYELAKSFLSQELKRVRDFGCKLLVLHPGSSVGAPEEFGLESIIEGLNEVLDNDSSDVTICLETMAGKGSELGRTFEQLSTIIKGVRHNERLGVCLDTCHINDYGYDVHDVEGVLDEFDRVIGLERLKVIHVNDSKNPPASHKDRHDNLGYGTIGFETLNAWVHNPRLNGIPKVLETPYVDTGTGDKLPPYKKEIEMLRSGTLEEGWREKL